MWHRIRNILLLLHTLSWINLYGYINDFLPWTLKRIIMHIVISGILVIIYHLINFIWYNCGILKYTERKVYNNDNFKN
jgi:cytochrome c oxidase subunit IV